jgi:hypothetical protein
MTSLKAIIDGCWTNNGHATMTMSHDVHINENVASTSHQYSQFFTQFLHFKFDMYILMEESEKPSSHMCM